MYMPLGHLAVSYEEALAPDVWVPSSQEKEDDQLSVYSLHESAFNKSRLDPSRLKREAS
jgi:hypothetical protein